MDAWRDRPGSLGHWKELAMDSHEVPNESEPVTPEASAPKRARRLPAKRTLASWCTQLERKGFSGIEAKRLILEKTHPRDEGLTRG